MQAAADTPEPVRCYEQENDGRIVLKENGESRLVVDPAQGGRWVSWEFALAGREPVPLLGREEARITAGPALLGSSGGAPEIHTGLGPASPSGLADHFLPVTARQLEFAMGTARRASAPSWPVRTRQRTTARPAISRKSRCAAPAASKAPSA